MYLIMLLQWTDIISVNICVYVGFKCREYKCFEEIFFPHLQKKVFFLNICKDVHALFYSTEKPL